MKGMTEKPLPGSDVEEGGARGTCGSAAQGGACAHTGTRAHGDAIAPCGRLAEVCAGRTAGRTHAQPGHPDGFHTGLRFAPADHSAIRPAISLRSQ